MGLISIAAFRPKKDCMVAADGRIVAGVCHARGANADMPKGWMVYMTVVDLKKSLAAAKKHGGTVLGKPRDAGGGTFCAIRDPSGAHVGLFQYRKRN